MPARIPAANSACCPAEWRMYPSTKQGPRAMRSPLLLSYHSQGESPAMVTTIDRDVMPILARLVTAIGIGVAWSGVLAIGVRIELRAISGVGDHVLRFRRHYQR